MPLTWGDLAAWAELMDRTPNPDEAWALIQLDRWDRNPGEKDAS